MTADDQAAPAVELMRERIRIGVPVPTDIARGVLAEYERLDTLAGQAIKAEADAVRDLEAELVTARSENDRLREDAANAVVRQVNLKGMTVEQGAALLELDSPRELVIPWVWAARKLLGDAPNYSETRIDFPTASASMEVKAAGEFERYVLTVQRAGKVTPHEARQAAEAAVAAVRALADAGMKKARARRETLMPGHVGFARESALVEAYDLVLAVLGGPADPGLSLPPNACQTLDGPAEAPASKPVDDHVAAWIKAARDRQNPDGTAWDLGRWNVLDDLLDDYRLHRATGTPLDQYACEGSYCCAETAGGSGAVSTRTPDPRDFDLCRIPEPPVDEGTARVSVGPAEAAEPARDRCRATEGATGVDCDQDAAHPLPHTGTWGEPGDEYSLAVTWPRVAEAAEPAHEVQCPRCGATIRARMADAGSASTTPDPTALDAAARLVLAEWGRMHPSGYLAMYPAMDALRAAVAAPRVEPALIGTWADESFVHHQDHKHPVEGCGYCPEEEDR